MSMYADRTAVVTFQATSWSGWSPDHYPITTSARLRVAKGSALNPETLGERRSDYAEIPSLFYELLVERLVAEQVLFTYRNLVVENSDGSVNLSGPRTGHFILRPGNSMRLSSATLDAGTSVSVTLDAIH